MGILPQRGPKLFPPALGVVTLAAVVLLLVQDAFPRWFPAPSHEYLAAFSLAMIAIAYLIFQIAQRASIADLGKATVLGAAFLFWAANQFWPRLPAAVLFNDLAIALFVLDLFLVISGWPQAPERRSAAGDRAAKRSALRGKAVAAPIASGAAAVDDRRR